MQTKTYGRDACSIGIRSLLNVNRQALLVPLVNDIALVVATEVGLEVDESSSPLQVTVVVRRPRKNHRPFHRYLAVDLTEFSEEAEGVDSLKNASYSDASTRETTSVGSCSLAIASRNRSASFG